MKLAVPALLAASVGASPLYRSGKAALESRALAVTAADVSSFAFYAQWAGASYCNSEVAPGTPVVCSDSVCTAVQAHNATVIANLGSSTSETNVLGFIGYDPVTNQIVLSFRGSSSLRNWIADLEFAQVACSKYISAGLSASIGSSCKMHDGFGKSWASMSATTFTGIAAARAAYPSAAVVVTGHSLGAAVATIAAAELRAQGYTLDLFTYGSPRVGNTAFVSYVSSQGNVGSVGSSGAAHYRVTHTDDPVPRLPPIALLDYHHTSPEFWLSNAGVAATANETGYFEGKIDYTAADIKTCTGYSNRDCNAGESDFDLVAHTHYFETIDGCLSQGISFK